MLAKSGNPFDIALRRWRDVKVNIDIFSLGRSVSKGVRGSDSGVGGKSASMLWIWLSLVEQTVERRLALADKHVEQFLEHGIAPIRL